MKKILLLMLVAIALMSCKSEQSKGEDLIDEYMEQTAYDYESYKPVSTEVRKCNRAIWSNLNAISVAKKIIEEYNKTHTSFNCLEGNDRYDVYDLIRKHREEFGDINTFEENFYDGYTIDQKFRIKSRGGYAILTTVRYIVDNDFTRVVESYKMPEDYTTTISVGYVLSSLWDVARSENKEK